MAIKPTILKLCPTDGRFLRQSGDIYSGKLNFTEINLPFAGADTSGDITLTDGSLSWSAADALSLEINGKALSLPMQIGEKTLTIQSMTPRAVVRTGKATAIEAYLGQTELSGDMVPARISTGTIDLKGVLNSTGLTGEAHANAIAISDIRDDPVYQPLLADFTADFREGGMVLTGPIKTARSKVTVADARMELDLLKLDGNASIISRPLVFEERGFQPTALSDRIRGFLSNGVLILKSRAVHWLEPGVSKRQTLASIQFALAV